MTHSGTRRPRSVGAGKARLGPIEGLAQNGSLVQAAAPPTGTEIVHSE